MATAASSHLPHRAPGTRLLLAAERRQRIGARGAASGDVAGRRGHQGREQCGGSERDHVQGLHSEQRSANGFHNVTFSPDWTYYADNYSRTDLPNIMELHRTADFRRAARTPNGTSSMHPASNRAPDAGSGAMSTPAVADTVPPSTNDEGSNVFGSFGFVENKL